MRDYGKVYSAFWASPTMVAADADGKLLALYLLTSPHTTMTGAFRLPDAYACEDLGWTSERFRNCLETISDFIAYDPVTKWVWVRKFLEFNPPANPNMWKAAGKQAASIPESVSFRNEVIETVAKPFLNTPSSSPSPSSSKSSTEDDEDQDGGEAPACPHEAIIGLYHDALPANPRIRQWTDSRKAALRARWREESKRQDLDYWRRFFAHVAASPFLTGQVTGKGERPFTPGLEWLLKAENFAKVIEGRYHDRAAA